MTVPSPPSIARRRQRAKATVTFTKTSKVEEPAGNVTSKTGRDKTPPWRGGRGCLGLDPSEPGCVSDVVPKKSVLGFAVPENAAGEGWQTLLGEEGEERLSLGLHFEP